MLLPIAWDVGLLTWLLLLEGSCLLQLHVAVGDVRLDLLLTRCCREHATISHLSHNLIYLGLAEQFRHHRNGGSNIWRSTLLDNVLRLRHMIVHIRIRWSNGVSVQGRQFLAEELTTLGQLEIVCRCWIGLSKLLTVLRTSKASTLTWTGRHLLIWLLRSLLEIWLEHDIHVDVGGTTISHHRFSIDCSEVEMAVKALVTGALAWHPFECAGLVQIWHRRPVIL